MSRFSLFSRNKPSEAVGSDLPAEEGNMAPKAVVRQKAALPPEGEDPILPEKKRARRRLVGAVTLTLSAVVVLPMIFESEPQTVSQDILIDIPSRDKPSQMVLRETAKKKTEEKAAAADTAAVKVATDNGRDASKQPEAKPDLRVEKAQTPLAKPTESKEPAKQENKIAAAKKTEDPIGQIIAKQQTAPKAEEQAKAVIQVAAVSSPDKAKELQDKLKKAGLSSYIQKVALKEGGERIRIRIGPLSGAKEINQTCAKLNQLKLPCTLVN